MKGPGLRSNLAGLRQWRCPQTGHELHTGPSVTSMPSPFAAGKWMQPVDPPRHWRPPVPIEQFVSVVVAEPLPVESRPVEPQLQNEAVSPVEPESTAPNIDDIVPKYANDDVEEFGDGLE